MAELQKTSVRHGFCDRCGKPATFPSWRETVCWRCAFGARLTEHRDRDRDRKASA